MEQNKANKTSEEMRYRVNWYLDKDPDWDAIDAGEIDEDEAITPDMLGVAYTDDYDEAVRIADKHGLNGDNVMEYALVYDTQGDPEQWVYESWHPRHIHACW